MSTINKAIDDLLEEAYRLSLNGDERFDTIDYNDDELLAKLRKVARVRSVTLDDLEKAHVELRAEIIERMKNDMAESRRCRSKRDDLRVFYVVNNANNRQAILARDATCARFFAHRSGHIRERKNGRVLVMNADREATLRSSGSALGRALREGYPGVVKEVGDNIVLEGAGKVYVPLTIVKDEDSL